MNSTREPEKSNLFFYGWVIVAITFISMILIYGIRHSFSVFLPHILNEFGWSRGNISLMLSLNIFIYGLISLGAGHLADHWRLRKIIPFGIMILGMATAWCAFAHELWHFYLLFGFLMPVGSAFTGSPVLYPTLMNWFAKRRGLVLGLGQMGAGLSFVYGIFIEFVILTVGWRDTYLVLAGILIGSLLPLYLLFFYGRPQEKGLKPYGTYELASLKDVQEGRGGAAHSTSGKSNLGEILKTYQLWFLVLSQGLYWGMGAYLVLAHQIKFAEDVGYSNMFSVSIFALFGITLCLGQFSGFLSDWIGRERTGTLAASLSVIGFSALLLVRDTSQPFLLYLYSICFGYGVGLFTPTLYASAADIFYERHYGLVVGFIHTGLGVGGGIGPWLGGYLFDISGSYRIAFILCICSIIIACLCLWGAAPRKAVKEKESRPR